MKLVDVTSFYAPAGGGIRTYLREKGRRLVARGHEVHRVVPGALRLTQRGDDGVTEHLLPGPTLPFDRNYRLFASLDALAELLHRLDPDVVEVGSHFVLPWCIRSLAPRRARIVGFFHSNLPDTFVAPVTSLLPRPLAAAAINLAWSSVRAAHARYDATLCASRAVETQLLDHGVPRVARVGLGVDARRFALRQRFGRTGRVCYVGRLSRDKEVALLLAAAPRLAAAGHELLVAGDGPLAVRFRRARGLRYLGALAPDEIGDLLRDSDACLVPGRYETFSFATAEALACGTPVVCADRGAAVELVERSGCGEAFRAGDARALVAAVERVVATPRSVRRSAAETARAFVERELSWDAVVDRVLAASAAAATSASTSSPAPLAPAALASPAASPRASASALAASAATFARAALS